MSRLFRVFFSYLTVRTNAQSASFGKSSGHRAFRYQHLAYLTNFSSLSPCFSVLVMVLKKFASLACPHRARGMLVQNTSPGQRPTQSRQAPAINNCAFDGWNVMVQFAVPHCRLLRNSQRLVDKRQSVQKKKVGLCACGFNLDAAFADC